MTTINEWHLMGSISPSRPCVSGEVQVGGKKRYITTSEILGVEFSASGLTTVMTRNSVYRLGRPHANLAWGAGLKKKPTAKDAKKVWLWCRRF